MYQAVPPATSTGTWTVQALYSFQGGAADGSNPGGLVMDSSGVIYGVTYAGGPGNCGIYPVDSGCCTIFSLTPPAVAGGAWTETVLYMFTGGADGSGPSAPLVIGDGGVSTAQPLPVG